MIRRAVILTLLATMVWGQTYMDPRGVGLCGAYTVASRGVSVVGFNPANLGFSTDVRFSMRLVGWDFRAYNNFVSLALFNQYFTGDGRGNPLNLEARKPGTTMTHKEFLISEIPENGVTFGLQTSIPYPALNVSFGNYALTSGIDIYQQTIVPRGVFRLPLLGNEAYERFDFSFGQDVIIISHFDFSFSIPFEDFYVGTTVKYLMGLGFAGVDSTGGRLTTEPEGLLIDGFYRYTRAVGGNGLAVDIGMTMEPKNNWQFGFAINNLIGFVNWGNEENFVNKNIKLVETLIPIRQQLDIPDDGDVFAARTLYTYSGDTTNVTKFLSGTLEDLWNDDKQDVPTADSIRMNYPAIVRLGASYDLPEEDLTIYMDLSTGLDDYYFASRSWRLALATEWTRFKRIPLRTGMAWGGFYGVEASLGSGFRLLWIDADIGLRLLGGMSLTKAEGVQLGISVKFRR